MQQPEAIERNLSFIHCRLKTSQRCYFSSQSAVKLLKSPPQDAADCNWLVWFESKLEKSMEEKALC